MLAEFLATSERQTPFRQLAARTGQNVVVEAIGGSVVGPQRLAQARPDGYTLSQMPNGVFRMPAMMRAPRIASPKGSSNSRRKRPTSASSP